MTQPKARTREEGGMAERQTHVVEKQTRANRRSTDVEVIVRMAWNDAWLLKMVSSGFLPLSPAM